MFEGEMVRAPLVVEPEDPAVPADEFHVDEVVRGRAVDVGPGRERARADEVAADRGRRFGGVDAEAAPLRLPLEFERRHARFDGGRPVAGIPIDPAHPVHVEDDAVREDEAEDAAAVAPDREGQAEGAGQADDRRDLVARTREDDTARHLRAGQRKGVVGIGPEDGRVVRGPFRTDDLPELPQGLVRCGPEHLAAFAPVFGDVVLERPHDRGRLHARDEMALGVADAAERAGVGAFQKRFRDRDPSFGQAPIEVHAALRVKSDETALGARRAEPVPEIVDLAHGVMTALGRRGQDVSVDPRHGRPPGACARNRRRRYRGRGAGRRRRRIRPGRDGGRRPRAFRRPGWIRRDSGTVRPCR